MLHHTFAAALVGDVNVWCAMVRQVRVRQPNKTECPVLWGACVVTPKHDAMRPAAPDLARTIHDGKVGPNMTRPSDDEIRAEFALTCAAEVRAAAESLATWAKLLAVTDGKLPGHLVTDTAGAVTSVVLTPGK